MATRRISTLDIWMNGLYVGQWERVPGGLDRLTYHPDWIGASEGRPLSLSLPFAQGHGNAPVPLRSEAVSAYFENLLPDNERILERVRSRFGARSTAAFDLLATIGRDCAGAVQLVPAGESPGDVRRIDAKSLEEDDVARILRETTFLGAVAPGDEDAFRISIAGAQEKVGLLRHAGRWCVPQGATPSTHLFKLPLGLVGNLRMDMRNSVENEWLCLQILREIGLPVAQAEIGAFEDQKVLIVERFDRRLSADGQWWQRIPQEDFCQVVGLPPSSRYESDGGPGTSTIMDVLQGSEQAAADRAVFFQAQLLFWLLAATDGHAKNFSIQLLPGGAYRLAPLYDVLSTYPVQGEGLGQLSPRGNQLRMAMAVQGENRHYVLRDIHRWHWVAMAERVGLRDEIDALIESLIEQLPEALNRVAARLPQCFPAAVFDAIDQGARTALQRLERERGMRNS